MRAMIRVSLLPLIVLAFAGCQEQSSSDLPSVQMKIGNRTFNLEVARTREAQERGLMKRDSMPQDHGMIFVFSDDVVRGFWMKNTRFALDILFVDSAGKIVSMRQMRPYDENNTSSDYPARYAIELNKGSAAAAGVKVGDTLQIPSEARSSGQ